MNFFSKNKAIMIEIIVALFIGFFILQGNITEPVFELSEISTNTDIAEVNINVAIEAEPSDSIVTLIAVGDIMLSRDVDTKIQKYQDYTYPFLKTADLLKSADITFGNLESPITSGRKINTNEMVFRADPEVVEGLNLAGFDILSLANNHSLNFGKEGLNDTFEYLEESGIKYTGAGKSISTSYLPVITEAQNITFAFLAYSYSGNALTAYDSDEYNPTVAFMDTEKMISDVTQAKQLADFVIVSMHDGYEYQFTPNQHQKNFAYSAIDAGATLVIGHHPHVVQTMEQYNNGYILYSLGNFVFDQMWSQETIEGMIAKMSFSREGIESFEFYPVIIEDYSQPRFASTEEEKEIIDRLNFDYQL